MAKSYNVGGIQLDRPFRVRRLGHFQFFSAHMHEALRFYTELLGFRVTDTNDMTPRVKSAEQMQRMGDPHIYFTRFGTDHHTFILSSDVLFEVLGFPKPPKLTIAQITWQVGSLKEVVDGQNWFREEGIRVMRVGRDVPGSNWNAYFSDPDGIPNEIYYGMEQIGWSGQSKPNQMYTQFTEPPKLPYIPEEQEVNNAIAAGVDLGGGNRSTDTMPFEYDVSGVLLARPFKITGFGPVRLMAPDFEASLHFYRDQIGLKVTEEVVWCGHRCVFLRAGSEHHSLALYPEAIGKELGLSDHSLSMSLGLRLGDYQQLKDAVAFFEKQGCTVKYLPAELSPGIDYSAFVVDPDGHLIQLYYYMEQVGWDGQPKPAALRRKVLAGEWPDTLEPLADTFCDTPYNGPWA